MNPVISFTKDFDLRLKDFKNILSLRDPPLLAEHVKEEWSYHLNLTVEPTGWHALWKISRETCEDLNINFPKVVFVYVDRVDFDNLLADVTVVGIQGNVKIPEKCEAPLIELFPTEKQEHSSVNAFVTASSLDNLRFFYTYLWYPWDVDETEQIDWPSTHLEPRLALYYNAEEGKMSQRMAKHIRFLTKEAKFSYDHTAKEPVDDTNQADDAESSKDLTQSQCVLYENFKHFLRFEQLKTELNALENPEILNLMEKEFGKEEKESVSNYSSYELLVWTGGSLEQFNRFVEESHVELTARIRIFSSLNSALETAVPGSKIFLPAEKYVVESMKAVSEGGSIIGVKFEYCLKAEISRNLSSNFLFMAMTNSLTLSNIKIDSSNVGTTIIVNPGAVLNLLSCDLDGKSIETDGVVVLAGGRVRIQNCSFKNLNCGVLCHPGSQGEITCCTFERCSIGFQAHGSDQIIMDLCNFVGCMKYGASFTKDSDEVEFQCGDVSLLQSLKNVKTKSIYFKENVVDVAIDSLNSVIHGNDPTNILTPFKKIKKESF